MTDTESSMTQSDVPSGVVHVPSPRNILGASILCYAIDPTWGNIYWLLGRERFVKGWKGSEKWSDFGGSTKPGEKPSQTAAREFHEETLAMVPFFEDEPTPRQSYDHIARALDRGEYTYRIETPIGASGSYVTYVCQIPLRPGVTSEVEATYTELVSAQKTILEGRPLPLIEHPAFVTSTPPRINNDFLEKTTVRYWSSPVMQRATVNYSGLIQNRQKSARPEQLRNTFRYRLKIALREMPVGAFKSGPQYLLPHVKPVHQPPWLRNTLLFRQ